MLIPNIPVEWKNLTKKSKEVHSNCCRRVNYLLKTDTEMSTNVCAHSLCFCLVYIHLLLAIGPIFSTKLPPSPTIEILFFSPSDSNSP